MRQFRNFKLKECMSENNDQDSEELPLTEPESVSGSMMPATVGTIDGYMKAISRMPMLE